MASPLGSACTTLPGPVREHPIRAHWLPNCTPTAVSGATFDVEALGDFAPSADTSETLVASDGKQPLLVPAATESVVVAATSELDQFEGTANVRADGSIDVALFPTGAACVLDTGAKGYPGAPGGQAVGVSLDGNVLLIAGGQAASSNGARTLDLGTGVASAVSADTGLRNYRTSAKVTSFGANLLVSGGSDESGNALGSAELFDVATRGFAPNVVPLEAPRSHHAAVVLDTGETLLIGGLGADGRALSTLEAVSPETLRYRIAGLGALPNPRVDPVAVKLTDGTVLVAGGTNATGDAEVTPLDWVLADGSVVETDALPDGDGAQVFGRAFAAMPGGGVLAVGGCVVNAGFAVASPCAAPSASVFWITKDRAVTALSTLDVPVANPVLIAGEGGRPWLVGSARDGTRTLLRFDPWLGAFTQQNAPTPPNDPALFFSVDSGLLGWFGSEPGGSAIEGFRHGVRGPFAQTVTPLLLADTNGVSLDRPAADGSSGDTAMREPSTGDVVLSGASTLVLTDATYTDVSLAISVTAGVPLVTLGGTTFGNSSCRWPAAPSAPFEADLERSGKTVRLRSGSKTRTCAGPDGRVSIALSAETGTLRVHSIAVTRGAP